MKNIRKEQPGRDTVQTVGYTCSVWMLSGVFSVFRQTVTAFVEIGRNVFK